jgi:SagB-type dehydrogenase family enzyme
MIMKFLVAVAIISGILLLMITMQPSEKFESSPADKSIDSIDVIKLPEPKYTGNMSIEEVLHTRRSIRDYKEEPLIRSEISQLLWAAQGITDTKGYRTAPSAGALYPLELYIAAGNVNDLPQGTYRYEPKGHELVKIAAGDKRNELSSAASSQYWIKDCAVIVVFAAVYERTTKKYGERGNRYVHMEVGHAAQNVYLQAHSLGLGTVVVGAFNDNEVKQIMNMTDEEQPLCIMPVGRK